MFSRVVSAVYLLSALTVWLKLQLLTDNWVGHAVVIITLGAIAVQEVRHTPRRYDTVSRLLASAGLVDGVVLVPLLLASLSPLLTNRSEDYFSANADYFWVSCLNSLHFLLTSVITYNDERISSYPAFGLLLTLILDFVAIFVIFHVSGIALVLLGIALILFHTLHRTLLMKIQKSFTQGEAAILSNGITLLSFIAWRLSTGNEISDPHCQHSVILLGLILGSVLICFSTFPILDSAKPNTNIRKNPVYFYVWLFIVIFVIVAPWVQHITGAYPVAWIFDYMLANLSNWMLVIYWILSLLILLPAIGYIQKYGTALIIIRKCFHLLGLIMFVPATAIAPRFLSLGYAIAFAALLIIEIINEWFARLMSQFEDPRDGGYFTVTHIYLLAGCAVPLWIMSSVGILILGVGDSCAAVEGTYWGRHKWPWPAGSSRSLEGSLASVLSVLLSVLLLSLKFNISVNWLGVGIAVGLASVLEAVTDQIDNIVLPLLFMALLNVSVPFN